LFNCGKFAPVKRCLIIKLLLLLIGISSQLTNVRAFTLTTPKAKVAKNESTKKVISTEEEESLTQAELDETDDDDMDESLCNLYHSNYLFSTHQGVHQFRVSDIKIRLKWTTRIYLVTRSLRL